MKSIATALIAFCLLGAAYAQDRRLVKQQIQDLSIRIERDAPYSEADLRDLREAKTLLREALALVNNRGGGNSQVYKLCVNYAFEKYKRSMSQSQALTRAQKNCKTVADMKVLEFLYEKHYRGTTSSAAMDLATTQADRKTEGRLNLIEFAYEKHYRGTTSSAAATKAVKNIASLRRNRGTLACFEQYYPIHYRSNTSSRAMDLTVQSCSNL